MEEWNVNGEQGLGETRNLSWNKNSRIGDCMKYGLIYYQGWL